MTLKKFFTTDTEFVDTRNGIFTSSGIWFSTTVNQLKEFAPAVLEQNILREILYTAEAWIRINMNVALVTMPMLIYFFPIQIAISTAIGFYLGLLLMPAGLITYHMAPIIRLIDQQIFQGVLTAIVLGQVAARGQYLAAGIGLITFILIRWGLIARIFKPIKQLIEKGNKIPKPDRVLRMVIIRIALKQRLPMPELDRITKEILKKY